MPRRNDIETILLIGSGPIVIGQACEFDYSGTQACRVLREEGYRVVLVNSNPATIMTDPEFADATYVEPLDVPTLERIIAKERPDAVLPTLGGQTGLNLAIALHEAGVLEKYNVEMIGANVEAIRTAEDRQRFKVAMTEIGLVVPPSGIAYTVDDALRVGAEVGYPVIIRPAYILGGGGTGIAYDEDEMRRVAERGLAASPISEILIERSIAGWKEYELEVMRDHADNVVVICSIENLDPMGVHTGESITVAPAQTLTDVEYQLMRDAAFACIRRIGVETGGSNVQFAVHPHTGEMVIIEMNPRVSRSSALASKATGFPIAKIAAKLAVGYRLDEVQNDITRETPASFEPTHRLRRHQVPALGVREAAGLESDTGHADAVGRRGDGHRPYVLRVVAEGRAFARDRSARAQLRPRRARARCPHRRRARLGRGDSHARSHLPTGSRPAPVRFRRTPERGHRHRPVVPRPDPPDRGGTRSPRPARARSRPDPALGLAPGQAVRLLRRPARLPVGRDRSRRAHPSARGGGAGHLQDRRHVRGRVRGVHPVSLQHLRGRGRDRAADQARGHHPGQRTEPDRSGCRVRLLLCPRRVRTPRRGLRDGDGQLQSGDGLDRLRHERPAVLRTPHERRRAERLPPVARSRRRARRDRQPGRSNPAQARAPTRAQWHPDPRHLTRVDRRGRGPRAVQRAVQPSRHPAARRCHGDLRRRSRRGCEHHRVPGVGAALVRARRARDADRLRRRRRPPRHGRARPHRLARTRRRTVGGASRARRPVLGGRDRGRRRRAARPYRRVHHRRRDGAHGTSRCALG